MKHHSTPSASPMEGAFITREGRWRENRFVLRAKGPKRGACWILRESHRTEGQRYVCSCACFGVIFTKRTINSPQRLFLAIMAITQSCNPPTAMWQTAHLDNQSQNTATIRLMRVSTIVTTARALFHSCSIYGRSSSIASISA